MLTVPFSSDEFFAVFAAYNAAVWPAQLVLAAAAAVAIGLTFRRSATADRWVAGFLAVLWLWTGAAYHMLHFTAINPAASVFAAMFVIQALLFLGWGVARGRLSFAPVRTARGVAAGAILAYALVIYPLLGGLSGHPYMASPTFGAPCPTVIYTFGILLLARSVPAWLLIIPVLWALVGSSAVLAFGVLQDVGLLASAVVAIGVVTATRRQGRRAALTAS
jgi:hypothetical protein